MLFAHSFLPRLSYADSKAIMSRIPAVQTFVRRAGAPEPTFRLFCFPHAGSGPTMFNSRWAQTCGLPETVEVVGILLPGRLSRFREDPLNSIRAIIDLLMTELEPLLRVQSLPFIFTGHSMGTVVAWELALAMRRRNWPMPMHFVMSGRYAPHLPPVDSCIGRLPDAEFLDTLERRYGYARIGDPEIEAMMLPAMKADIVAVEEYLAPGPLALPIPMTVVRGENDKHVPDAMCRLWSGYTSAVFKFVVVPGVGHFFYENPLYTDTLKGAIALARRALGQPVD